MHTEDDTKLTPREVRALARDSKLTAATFALYPDYVKTSLLILPVTHADDLLYFAPWNPETCPVLEVIRKKPLSSFLALGASLCTDFPRYRVFLNGEVSEEVCEVKALWNIDSVDFLLGYSASFDGALFAAGLPARHVEEHRAMPIYQTRLRTCSAGPFRGPVLVSMRPLPQAVVKGAYQLTGPMELVHGAPIQVGAPEEIGVADLNKPGSGEAADIRDGETPVFWSSSTTVQAALRFAKLPLAITNVPSYSLISDIRSDALPELFQREKTRV